MRCALSAFVPPLLVANTEPCAPSSSSFVTVATSSSFGCGANEALLAPSVVTQSSGPDSCHPSDHAGPASLQHEVRRVGLRARRMASRHPREDRPIQAAERVGERVAEDRGAGLRLVDGCVGRARVRSGVVDRRVRGGEGSLLRRGPATEQDGASRNSLQRILSRTRSSASRSAYGIAISPRLPLSRTCTFVPSARDRRVSRSRTLAAFA